MDWEFRGHVTVLKARGDSGSWDTEMISMSLSSSTIFGDPDFDEFLRQTRLGTVEMVMSPPRSMDDWEFRGHVTVLKASDIENADDPNVTYYVMDVDASLNNRRPLDPATVTRALHFRGHVTVLKSHVTIDPPTPGVGDTVRFSMEVDSGIGGGGGFPADSFFDVFVEVNVTEPQADPDTPTVDYYLAGGLTSSGGPDSFFDVTTRKTSLDGSEDEYRVKVRFPWLPTGTDNTTTRFMVGAIFGDPDFDAFWALPEVDDEVLVVFLSEEEHTATIMWGDTVGEGNGSHSIPPFQMEYSITVNGTIVVEGNSSGDVDGLDFLIWQRRLTEDVEGLEGYRYDVRLRDLIPGKVPGIEVDTEYYPTIPNRYFSVVSSRVETTNEGGLNETIVVITIDTFEHAFDPATGELIETWLSSDIVTVRTTREVRADGSVRRVQEVRQEVQSNKNG